LRRKTMRIGIPLFVRNKHLEIREATHTVLLEKNRTQRFQAVQQFLDERREAGR
jgi:alpha-beta hydrolase superfamily lysophospholipase